MTTSSLRTVLENLLALGDLACRRWKGRSALQSLRELFRGTDYGKAIKRQIALDGSGDGLGHVIESVSSAPACAELSCLTTFSAVAIICSSKNRLSL